MLFYPKQGPFIFKKAHFIYFCNRFTPYPMIIRTKKTKLSPSAYIRIAMLNILREQWWVGILAIGAAAGLLWATYKISAIIVGVLLILYILFWWTQVYGLTKLEENQLMFERLFYELNNERLIIFLNTRQGMPIDWKQINSARHGKDHFLLFISKGQFIYLPHSAFQNQQQINLVHILLKNKKLI